LKVRANPPVAKIKDYGVIGDCRSAAMVSKYGSVDWLCWPRFDSPSIFAAILDPEKGGHWSIRPAHPFIVERSYIDHTNVLETGFSCAGGQMTLTDLMPVCSEEFKGRELVPDHEMIREVRCTAGEMEIEIEFKPRCDYGCDTVRIRNLGPHGLRMDVGRGAYWLHSSVPLKVSDGCATASARIKEGDVVDFSLTYSEESPTVLPALGARCQSSIARSIRWWEEWADHCRYDGPYRDVVLRSALALKLLTYAPSGAVTAAITTSLPERVGDKLNWDYRYCWLRDASVTIRGLLGLGYFEEAESFLTWLLHATRLTQPRLHVLYTVFGGKCPRETELNHLCGYQDSRPVRLGNGARNQLQLDIYGGVIEAAAQYAEYLDGFDRMTQKALIGLGKTVAKTWDQPDEGIWEPRHGRANHTHSRLMCWSALDRLLALSDKGVLQGVPRELFTRQRDLIRQQIESRAWNDELQSYTAVLNGDLMDATLLRLAWYGFEHADSARMKGTYRKVRERLGAGDTLLYRYEREQPEGAFGICGFWAVEHLAVGGGTLEQAHHAFQQLLHYQNDLGLYAEEIDPHTGDALGNFPQAFTHVGLISAALTLAERERGEAHPAVKVGSDVKAPPTAAQSEVHK
jgi:GH15 family glucan-1,4-alpha-glucosidase